MTFPEELAAEMKRLDLTQDETAELLACGKRILQYWLKGERLPLMIAQEGALARLRGRKRVKGTAAATITPDKLKSPQ